MSVLTAPAAPLSRLRNPWARLGLMLVAFVLLSGLTQAMNAGVSSVPVLALIVGVATAAATVWIYRKAVALTERRDAAELSLRDAASGLRAGVLLGSVLFGVTIAVITLFGHYRITGWGSVGAAVSTAGLMACVAVSEEILFRGIAFRLVEEIGGTRIALAFTALLFGALHLVNANATVWGAIAIAIEAGLMMGAAYAATRSLWLPIGLHFAWNLAEGGIFATTVSGSGAGATGLFHSILSGPVAVSGGAFGPEASVIAILTCTVPTVYFLRMAHRRGQLRGRAKNTTTLAG